MRKNILLLIFLFCGVLMAVKADPADTVTVRLTFCDSIKWYGTTYYQDTVAEHLVTHEAGNDTLFVLYLTMHYSTRTDYYDTACRVYYWHGGTYTESGVYVIHHQAANGCDSAEVLHLTMRPVPDPQPIVGDTLVCRNQYAVLAYPLADTLQYRYEWYRNGSLMAVNQSRIQWLCPADSSFTDSVAIFRMVVSDLYSECGFDTAVRVMVAPFESPSRPEVTRKPGSNILVCSPEAAGNMHYRWGMTDKVTVEETAYEWDYNYFQYDFPINTDQYDYWVEVYRTYGEALCRNRAYYEDGTATEVPVYDVFSATAFVQDDQLLIRVENPSQQPMYAVLRDVSGKELVQFSLGTAPAVSRNTPFRYAKGLYLLTLYAGNQCLTLKIAK